MACPKFKSKLIFKNIYIFSRSYSIPKMKQLSTEIALNHFDQFYKTVFSNWPSIRLGLLSPQHYCAVMNVFAKAKSSYELFGDMEVFNLKDIYYKNFKNSEDDIESDKNKMDASECNNDQENSLSKNLKDNWSIYYEAHHNESYATVDDGIHHEYMPATKFKNRDQEEFTTFYDASIEYNAQIVKHGIIQYPEHWGVYLCPRGNFKKFPPPKIDATGLLNYYLMDGASILPVLALDIKKGEDVGDLCASPGGKTLAILFGFQFGKLVCNDASLSRINKLKTVLNTYLPGTKEWSKRILVSNLDIREWKCFEAFDKILLDVPCTNDRMSVMKESNSIFNNKRFNERMQIPQIQTNMLSTALKALKPGGSLVYSTCSLSPIQNDGVVHMALTKLSTECPMEFSIQDLTDVFFPFKKTFQFSYNCIYGQLVVPFLPLNYGPMYICKISRIK